MAKSPLNDPEMSDIDEMGRLERRRPIGKAPVQREVLIAAAIVVIAAAVLKPLSR